MFKFVRELCEENTWCYIYGIYAVYEVSVEARYMNSKIKKDVGPCNFLKPRGVLQSTTTGP